ncbi:hypothetical protein [Pseudarthrobacter sp. NS4]|uniref:hypothetical protein n=1 Tax=Pseudarthrobacter sp. NS4 TaxID=2973976 RepID=UPI0021627162|nr:hypothetical protein [Pseudarthrobacter sp. NS4]
MVPGNFTTNHPHSAPRYFHDLQDLVLESSDVEAFLAELAAVAARSLSSPALPVACGVAVPAQESDHSGGQ